VCQGIFLRWSSPDIDVTQAITRICDKTKMKKAKMKIEGLNITQYTQRHSASSVKWFWFLFCLKQEH